MKLTNYAILILFVLFHTSCKKKEIITEEKESIPEELTFSKLLNGKDYHESVTQTTGPWYEYGIKFKTTTNGKITKLGCKLPKSGNYRINIWDSNKSVIKEINVNQDFDNTFKYKVIDAVEIEKDKEYFISILSNNWNDLNHNIYYRIPYPIIVGNIQILQFAYISQTNSISTAKYPTFIDNYTSISGFIDFSFVPSTIK